MLEEDPVQWKKIIYPYILQLKKMYLAIPNATFRLIVTSERGNIGKKLFPKSQNHQILIVVNVVSDRHNYSYHSVVKVDKRCRWA